jgi:hypothetical protein
MPMRPAVTLTLNGRVIDRERPAEAHVSRDYDVDPARAGARNVLEMQVDRTLNPARQHVGEDPRDLGLLVHLLGWGPKYRFRAAPLSKSVHPGQQPTVGP